ncbi:hypothetical protein FHR83_000832 [Actinoplanes campanulatus]|uniref:Secreted protein n=1 Tax=Actinoplanes campanulatus TaxID=113559 RepID=A0A7W5ABH6_9ACTN|nr:hypothetical protein [Actinoplanes campanulatus]MBB3093198.1 hypothetical protein [Actinoplanes campanulatus]GGN01889.1 hypothetical protein GCM10010109_07600 [Actinoplanes campanulatus]GID33706.1 hypothetical protein Aca09nite_02120 [Actinoplanes campanulatus]
MRRSRSSAYRRPGSGLTGRNRKIAIGLAVATLAGGAFAVSTGMSNAATNCSGLDQSLRDTLSFMAEQRANPNAQTNAVLANRQAVVDMINVQRQQAGCTANIAAPPAANPPANQPDTGSDQSGATGNAGAGSGNIDALVPALGFSPGDPNATADRVGPTGVNVPGRCPPTQAQVNAQVALKNANFPSGTDLESRIQRFEKTLSAIQDLKCPASSTTLLGRLNSLTALRANADRDNILRGLGLNETPAG